MSYAAGTTSNLNRTRTMHKNFSRPAPPGSVYSTVYSYTAGVHKELTDIVLPGSARAVTRSGRRHARRTRATLRDTTTRNPTPDGQDSYQSEAIRAADRRLNRKQSSETAGCTGKHVHTRSSKSQGERQEPAGPRRPKSPADARATPKDARATPKGRACDKNLSRCDCGLAVCASRAWTTVA